MESGAKDQIPTLRVWARQNLRTLVILGAVSVALLVVLAFGLLQNPVHSSTSNSGGDSASNHECDSAMLAASRVPLSQTNDAEFIAAAEACDTIEQFTKALYTHPKALGLPYMTADDVHAALVATCLNMRQVGPLRGACVEASDAGYLD